MKKPLIQVVRFPFLDDGTDRPRHPGGGGVGRRAGGEGGGYREAIGEII